VERSGLRGVPSEQTNLHDNRHLRPLDGPA